MAIRAEHEIHGRRRGRNLGVGLALAGLIAIVFGLTMVKVKRTGLAQGYDHVVRPEMLTQPDAGQGPESAAPASGAEGN